MMYIKQSGLIYHAFACQVEKQDKHGYGVRKVNMIMFFPSFSLQVISDLYLWLLHCGEHETMSLSA
jgi:hypothetical protein